MDGRCLKHQYSQNDSYYYIATSVWCVRVCVHVCERIFGNVWFWTFKKSLTFWRGTCYTSGWMLPRNYKHIPLRKTFSRWLVPSGEKPQLFMKTTRCVLRTGGHGGSQQPSELN